jgi:transcription-repair coupling factor (superfamily II helicase)
MNAVSYFRQPPPSTATAATSCLQIPGSHIDYTAYLLSQLFAANPEKKWLLLTQHPADCKSIHQACTQLGLTSLCDFTGPHQQSIGSSFFDNPLGTQNSENYTPYIHYFRHQLSQQHMPAISLIPLSWLGRAVMPQAVFIEYTHTYSIGQTCPQETLIAHLLQCGYQRTHEPLQCMGYFAVRGGVVDCFPPHTTEPLRLDFWGDTLNDIIQLGETLTHHHKLPIYPIHDILWENTYVHRAQHALAESHLLKRFTDATSWRLAQQHINDMLASEATRTVWPLFYNTIEPLPLQLLAQQHIQILHIEPMAALPQISASQRRLLYPPAHESAKLALHVLHQQPNHHIAQNPCQSTEHPLHICRPLQTWSIPNPTPSTHTPAEEKLTHLLNNIQKALTQGLSIWLSCRHHHQRDLLHKLLQQRQYKHVYWTSSFLEFLKNPRNAPALYIGTSCLSIRCHDTEQSLVILDDAFLFGPRATTSITPPPPRSAKTPSARLIQSLKLDDIVIHKQYGFGQFVGLSRMRIMGVDADFAVVEYAQHDKLYLPLHQIGLLQKASVKPEKLDRLGSARFAKTKLKIKAHMVFLAQQLLKTQAERQRIQAPTMLSPNAQTQYEEFVAHFPYEETPDQQKAIDDVCCDLQKGIPMDRLICGDVGFGKTEVALRAAFLSVISGYQVAVLVPTTVLAYQHEQKFKERCEAFGVRIATLRRQESRKTERATLTALRNNQIDILIGTHRLLSPDVQFARCGLLIVDEEHRFGVADKEKIKRMAQNIHVLTLTATPIPRTLYMATAGLRDLSLIHTPPTERSSIHFEVHHFQPAIFEHAIRHELGRNGQVFVIHDRIASIERMATWLRKKVPEARIAVVHGSMKPQTIQRLMEQFAQHQFDVLVCTTLIESGIDIPRVNTLIIHRADRYGLAQLHQLRGRVGRGHVQAYAYALVPPKMGMAATQRLAALQTFQQLGAGFHIANADLENRGAGDLLGHAQAGNSVHAVGLTLYHELLQEALQEVTGSAQQKAPEPDIHLPFTALLPEDYVPHALKRLEYYQEMAQANDFAELERIFQNLSQAYGPLPIEATQLHGMMRLRLLLLQSHISFCQISAKEAYWHCRLIFAASTPIPWENWLATLKQRVEQLHLSPPAEVRFRIGPVPEHMKGLEMFNASLPHASLPGVPA